MDSFSLVILCAENKNVVNLHSIVICRKSLSLQKGVCIEDMRAVLLRGFSMAAFTFLTIWELWKMIERNEIKKRNISVSDSPDLLEPLPLDSSLLTNEYFFTKFEKDIELSAIQRRRKNLLTGHCHKRKRQSIYPTGANGRNHFEINPHSFKNILVNDKQQLLYCAVPQVADKSWKKVFLKLNGYVDDTSEIKSLQNFSAGYFPRLSDYSPAEINLRMTTYYKFLFARHPYSRLVSAFQSEIVQNKHHILERYDILESENEIKRTASDNMNSEPTFVDFVNFLTDALPNGKDIWNAYWQRIDRLCFPCLMRYDFIGKFESLDEDANFLLRTLDIHDQIKFPRNIISNTGMMKDRFQTLSSTMKKKLYKLYQDDFLMFNYTTEIDPT